MKDDQQKKEPVKKDVNELKRKEQQGRESWNIRPYLAIGLTAFIVLAAGIILYFAIDRYHGASENIAAVLSILQPVVIGSIIAYLLNPLVNRIQQGITKLAETKCKNNALLKKASRPIGILSALCVLGLFFTVFFYLVVPQLYITIEGLVISLPRQAREASRWIQDYLTENEALAGYMSGFLTEGTKYVENWLRTDLLPQSKEIFSQVTSGIIVFAKAIINVLIGLIVCIYVLIEKDHFVGIFKKIIYGLFPVRTSNRIIRVARKSHSIFIGFIVGKIIDSLVVGVLCYIALRIFRMPYALLVSFIVGVTNIVPVFGPYVGAVPSFLLILLADPIKAVYFLIIIVVLQQIDGNIIGPKILGGSTGLSAFWVIFAILLGSGLFGFMGMLFGVPIFAVIYYVINEIIKKFLQRKHLPTKSEDYLEVDYLDEESREFIKKE